MSHPPLPLLGVGVLIFRDGKLLLGQRRGAHGAGSWAPPGGHLEPGESVEECARREALEETGLPIEVLRSGPWTEDHFPVEGKRYVTLFVVARVVGEEDKADRADEAGRAGKADEADEADRADRAGGIVREARLLEPEKCAGWGWFPWTDLPSPLFAPLGSLRRSGFDPIRAEGSPSASGVVRHDPLRGRDGPASL